MGKYHGQEYIGFPVKAYKQEAAVIQARVETRRQKGIVVTSDEAWAWIKERHPVWCELDREKAFQLVKL